MNKLTVSQIMEELETKTIHNFRGWCIERGIPFIFGVRMGSNCFAPENGAPLVLVHSGADQLETLADNHLHVPFTVVHGGDVSTGHFEFC